MIKNLLIAGLSIFLLSFTLVNAENYRYNFTDKELEEIRLSDLCFVMQEDLKIDALQEHCIKYYGGFGPTYGDKIK